MLLVKQPSKSDLLSVLQGLLDESLTREEVVAWCQGVENQFDDVNLSIDNGYWYFKSLSALEIPIGIDDGEPFFIRKRDIEEYLLDLEGVPCAQSFEGITRVRHHQADKDSVRWPLLMFEHTDINRLDNVGLFPVRGIFDVHMDLVEHTHLYFRGDLYLIVRQYDDQAHQLMVLGTNREEARLREFLSILDLA